MRVVGDSLLCVIESSDIDIKTTAYIESKL